MACTDCGAAILPRYQVCGRCRKQRRLRSNQAAKLKYRYALTAAEFETLLNAQGGACAICKRPEKDGRQLAVDHNHRNGQVRGLLCASCNLGLGKLGDNWELVHAALSYLIKHSLINNAQ